MKRGFTLIELAIVIVIAALLAAVAIPIYQGIVEDSKWTEGETAIGSIKSAVEVYAAKHSNNLSALPNGAATAGPTGWPELIRLEPGTITKLQYFNMGDFSLTTTVVAGPPRADTFTVTLNASGGGISGNGPTAGTMIFNSADGKWTKP